MTSISNGLAANRASAPGATLPLLCALGRHRTDRVAHWNDGYYFSSCRRCGQDLVRTAFGEWAPPKGFRVVWAAEPPRGHAGSPMPSAFGGARERRAGAPSVDHDRAPQETPVPPHDERIDAAAWANADAPSGDGGAAEPVDPPALEFLAQSSNAVAGAVGVASETLGAPLDGTSVIDGTSVSDGAATGDGANAAESPLDMRPPTDGASARTASGLIEAEGRSALRQMFGGARGGELLTTAEPASIPEAASVPTPVSVGDPMQVDGSDAADEPARVGPVLDPAFSAPTPSFDQIDGSDDAAHPVDGSDVSVLASGSEADFQPSADVETPAFLFPNMLQDDGLDDGTNVAGSSSTRSAIEDEGDDAAEDDDLFEVESEAPMPLSASPAPSVPRYPVIPDFMDEGPLDIPYDLRTGEILREVVAQPAPPPPVRDPGSNWGEAMRGRAQAVADSGRAFVRSRRVEAGHDKSAPLSFGESNASASSASRDPVAHASLAEDAASPNGVRTPPAAVASPMVSHSRALVQRPPPRRTDALLERYAGIGAVAIFGTFLLAATMVDGAPSSIRKAPRADAPVTSSAAPATPASAALAAAVVDRPSAARTATPPVAGSPVAENGAGDVAFVTASLLQCRSTPSDDGDTVRRLSRGAPVQVLGVNPGWVNLSHQGRRCWASADYISTERPT